MKKINLFIIQKFKQQMYNVVSEIIDLLSNKNTNQLNFILKTLNENQKEELHKHLLNGINSNDLVRLLCRCSLSSLNIWLNGRSLNELSENNKKIIILDAIRGANLEKLKFFEEKGVDITKDYDFFDSPAGLSLPLHLVIDETLFYEKIKEEKSYRTEILDYYLSKKDIDINMQDKNGKHINDMIHLNVNPEIFEYYIEKGMDVNKPFKKEKNILESSLKSVLCHVVMGNAERIDEYTNNIKQNIEILNKYNIKINVNNSKSDQYSGEYDIIRLALELENQSLLELIYNMYVHEINNIEKQNLIEKSFYYNSNIVKWLLEDLKPNKEWYKSDMIISCISLLNIFKQSLSIPRKFKMSVIIENLKVIRKNRYSIWNKDCLPFHLIAEAPYNQYVPEIMKILSEMGFNINQKNKNGLEAINLIEHNQEDLQDVFLQERSKIENKVISDIWEDKENKNTKKRL